MMIQPRPTIEMDESRACDAANNTNEPSDDHTSVTAAVRIRFFDSVNHL